MRQKQLEKLFLGENKLTELDKGVFAGLEKLRFLDLNENFISTLSEAILKHLPRLLRVVMSDPTPEKKETDNPWDCQSLCWLQEEMKAGKVKFWRTTAGTFEPLCADGRRWDDLVCGEYFDKHLGH